MIWISDTFSRTPLNAYTPPPPINKLYLGYINFFIGVSV